MKEKGIPAPIFDVSSWVEVIQQQDFIGLSLYKIFGLVAFVLLLANCSSLGGPISVRTGAGATSEGALIQEITCGGGPPARASMIFSAERNFGGGWNHIANPAKAGDFLDLKQPYSHYNITNDKLREDASCGGEKTYSAVLVKKFHTWDNTHSNGLQTDVAAVPVEDIESLVIELKVNSAGSVIPSRQQIASAFPWLTPKQVRNLDRGAANIDMVLSSGAARANKILSIDQAKYADKWLRITIPMQHMHYYDEVNYVRTHRHYHTAKNQSYNNLIITAESQNRKTVQSLTGGTPSTTPLFKEVDVSIRRIYYLLK